MRSHIARVIVMAGLMTFSVGLTLAQASRVVVSRVGDDEVRRTAYRLRLCPGDLENARQALAKAEALVPEVATQAWVGNFGNLVNRLDREHASEIVARLLSQLADQAGRAEDFTTYQQVFGSAQQLLYALRETDAETAAEIVRKWPEFHGQEPVPSLSEQMRRSLARQEVSWLGRSDPVKAVERLREFEGGQIDLQARCELIQQLAGSGAGEEAGRLLDESLAATFKTGVDPSSIYSFSQFFSTASYAFPDRLPGMLSQLGAALGTLPEGPTQELQQGGSKISVSNRENLVLSVVRSFSNRPDTLNRVLDLAPGLRQKLAPLGGIDGFLSPRPSAADMKLQGTLSELRSGKVSDTSVDRLEDPNANSGEFQALIDGVQRVCEHDPDRALTILERTSEILAKKESAQALGSFPFLIYTCLNCQGVLSPRIVEQGNKLVSRLRSEQSQAEAAAEGEHRGPNSRFMGDQVDQFEAVLIAAQAIEDFGRAMDLAARNPEPRLRFLAYLQIAQQIAR